MISIISYLQPQSKTNEPLGPWEIFSIFLTQLSTKLEILIFLKFLENFSTIYSKVFF